MRKGLLAFFREKLRMLFPFVLSVVLSSAVFSIYGISVISLWTLAIILICGVVFVLCEFVNIYRGSSRIYLTLIILIDVLLFIHLLGGNVYRKEFLQWFFEAGSGITVRLDFLLALLAGFPVFFSLTVYYFTNIQYRMSFLTLLSLFPCVLYVKVIAEINNVYLIIIALLNLIIFVLHRIIKGAAGARMIGGKSFVLSVGLFAFILLITASAIPKESQARYYSSFERIFISGNTSIIMGENYSDINDVSGNADNYEDMQNRQMYTVFGENVPYLKRQNFYYYDFENDRWYSDENSFTLHSTTEKWYEEHAMLNLTALQTAIKRAEEYEPGFAERHGLEALALAEPITDSIKNLYVQSNNFGASYYLSTARCVYISANNVSERYYATESGCFRIAAGKRHPPNTVYRVTYYDEIASKDNWLQLGGADFDDESAEKMLGELWVILLERDDQFADIVWDFNRQRKKADWAKEDYRQNNDLISDEVKKLALEITQGCTYDWQKAEALQNYFMDNGFVYDLKYTAEDTSPEYFLFKSKKGTCSDFASAFVLMARAAGLNARYTEGYNCEEGLQENVYTISDRNSHAYPEVFIQNMGWTVYEPTVPSMYNDFKDGNDGFLLDFGSLEMDYRLMLSVLGAAGVVMLAVLMLLGVIPYADEKLFACRIRNAAADKCIVRIYGRIVNKMAAGAVPDIKKLTPYEAAQRLDSLTGCNIYNIAFLTEEVLYGGNIPTENDKVQVIDSYLRLKKALKTYNKKLH